MCNTDVSYIYRRSRGTGCYSCLREGASHIVAWHTCPNIVPSCWIGQSSAAHNADSLENTRTFFTPVVRTSESAIICDAVFTTQFDSYARQVFLKCPWDLVSSYFHSALTWKYTTHSALMVKPFVTSYIHLASAQKIIDLLHNCR